MREAHTMTTQFVSALADIGFVHVRGLVAVLLLILVARAVPCMGAG